jgi:hypothetical protein
VGEPNSETATGIPIVGRLTPLELAGFVLLILLSAVGTYLFVDLIPIIGSVASPGSGGGAQMIVAMVFGPFMLLAGSMAIGGAAGFVVLVIFARKRIRRRIESQNADQIQAGE